MKKKVGIQKKLLRFILPVVAISFVSVIVVAYYSSKNSIGEKTQKLLKSDAATSSTAIEAWANKNLGTLQTAVNTMENLDMNREEILNYESFYLEKYEDIPNGIYIANEKKEVYDATGWEPDGDVTQSSWYIEGKDHDQMAFGEPYVDDYTGGYIVTASQHIDSLDGNYAVVAADVSLNILSQVVSEMDVEGNGDAFIISAADGSILAHKNSDIVGKTADTVGDPFYKEIAKKVQDGNFEGCSIDSKDGKYMVNMESVKGTPWVVVVRSLESNIYSDIRVLGVILSGIGVFGVIVVTILLIVMVGRIIKPIQNITDTIVAVTGGDFTVDVAVKGNDEVSVMAGSMKQFVSSMRATITTIRSISDKIDQQAQGSNEISGELHDSASGQSEAMSQMLDNLDELVQSIGVIAENATTLAIVVSESNEFGENALENISSTMKEADNGRTSMQSVTTSMNEMRHGMDDLEHAISDVGEAAGKINEITATIRDIADETNLLALNASIEAARAGEAGKGFAVVADQIKKLAENSGEAAVEISQLIDSVTELIKTTVKQSEESVESIKESTKLVDAASDQFNSIFNSIESTNGIINEMIAKVRTANDVAANMAAITQEQSASAEEIEATAVNIQKLAESVTENSAGVKDGSTELAESADVLKQKISGFTIG